jgi:hypothetical protein
MRSGSAKGASFAGAGLEVVESETTVVGGTSDGTAAAKSGVAARTIGSSEGRRGRSAGADAAGAKRSGGARITARYGRESLE